MAVEVGFARATRAHAVELAAVMCDEDVAEVVAGGRDGALDALEFSLRASEVAVTMLFDRRVAAMFGVQALEGPTWLGSCTKGIAWVLTAKVTREHPLLYARWSRRVVEQLLRYCPDLTNLMDARHAPARAWAKWMGFEMGDPVSYGPQGLAFIPFRVRL